MNHKYSSYALLGIGVLFIIVFFVLALDSSDLDDICSQNNMTLIRINGVWGCGSLNISVSGSMFNSTYDTWAHNQTYSDNDSLYVPYINATEDIDIGNNSFTSNKTGTFKDLYLYAHDGLNKYGHLFHNGVNFVIENLGGIIYLANSIEVNGNILASAIIGESFSDGIFSVTNGVFTDISLLTIGHYPDARMDFNGTSITNRFGNIDFGDDNLNTIGNITTKAIGTFGAGIFNGTLKIIETGASPTKYTIFQGGNQVIDLTYTLPTAMPTANSKALLSSTAGNLSWATNFGANDIATTGSVSGSILSATSYIQIKEPLSIFSLFLKPSGIAFGNYRSLYFNLSNADRTLNIQGNPILDDWFNQAVKTTSSPTFGNITVTNLAGSGNAFACLDSSGKLYRSVLACV